MMKPWRLICMGASLIAAAATPAAERVQHPVSREHLTTLESYGTALVRGYLDGDPSGIVRHLSGTLQLLPAYQKSVLGKDNAATYHQAFLKRFAVSAYRRQPIEVADLGGRILEIGRFTITLAARGSGKALTFTGKYLDLWSKTAAGTLELDTAAWNHDEPPLAADDLRFAEVPSLHLALQPRVPLAAGISLELGALQKLQESAIAQHDGKTWALFYADDAILLANHGGVVSGRAALDQYTLAHANALPVFEKLDLRTQRIDDLGEYVVEYASGVAHWKAGDASGVSLGKNIIVWRREASGRLKIWRAISMYD